MNASLVRAPDDVDRSAVHVKFGLASQFIVPCPGKGVLSRFDAIRDFEFKGRGASAVGVLAQVRLPTSWASTFNRMNDTPLGVCGWFLVFGKRYLARSSAVRSPADEREGLRLSDLELVLSKGSFVFIDASALLARKIGPVRLQIAIVEARFAVRDRGAHFHMSVGGRDETEGRSHQEGSCRTHADDAKVFVLRTRRGNNVKDCGL